MIGMILLAIGGIALVLFAGSAIQGIDDLINLFTNPWILIPLVVGVVAVVGLSTKRLSIDFTKRSTKLIAVGFIALFLILLVGPTIADGTVGQTHYSLKGTVNLTSGLLGFWPPTMTISDIHSVNTGFISITNVETPIELTCINCGGTIKITAIGPLTKTITKNWAIGLIPGMQGWTTNIPISIPGLIEGNYTVVIEVTEATTGQTINQNVSITIP